MDVGFLREEDFQRARDSFLHALDFALVGGGSSQQQAPFSPDSTAPSGQESPMLPKPVPVLQAATSEPAAVATGLNRPRALTENISGSSTPRAEAVPTGPSLAAASQHARSASMSVLPAAGTGGVVPIPTDLPRAARGPVIAGKV